MRMVYLSILNIYGLEMKKIISLIVLVLIALGGYFYATPYLAISNLGKAVKEGNTTKVSEYVDYDHLRQNINRQLKIVVTEKMMNDPELNNNPFAGLALAMVTKIVDEATDTLVSPEGMSAMLDGKKPSNSTGGESNSESSSDKTPWEKAEKGYDGYDWFVVSVLSAEGYKVDFKFRRQGLTGWKLSEIKFPSEFFAN